jgi:hypothetical protein
MNRTTVNEVTGCWEWTGCLSARGYGQVRIAGVLYAAHRVAYEIFTNSAIPVGLELDHLCRVKKCIRPAHLEPVTHLENVHRAIRIGHDHPNAPKTCRRGHDWSVTPPYVSTLASGREVRYCRTCRIEDTRRRRAHVAS